MLTDLHCKNATCPPDRKRARFTDSAGLYLEVSPAGSKRWFWKTYADGKEGRLALGSYPAMRVADARKARDAARLQKAVGVDPVQARRLDKLKGQREGGGTFKAVALEWRAKQVEGWSPEHARRTLRQLERDLFPWLGDRPMAAIEPMELLAVLQKVEERGALETADRALMLARQVYEYWLPTADKAQRNITEGLKKRLTPYRGKHFAAIVEPQPCRCWTAPAMAGLRAAQGSEHRTIHFKDSSSYLPQHQLRFLKGGNRGRACPDRCRTFGAVGQ